MNDPRPGTHVPLLPEESARRLATALALRALAATAPHELPLLEESAAEYFEDPAGAVAAARREEALGFGLEIALITPYVLAMAGAVVSFLASAVVDSVKTEAKPVVESLVRRMIGREATDPAALLLSVDQARRVRLVALEQATALGLPERTAVLLADAVVGGIVTAGRP